MKDSTKKMLISASEFSKATGLQKLRLEPIAPSLMKWLKLMELNQLYSEASSFSGADFASEVVKKLNIDFEFPEEELNNIPKEGSFVIVSNHPFGGLDGLILIATIAKIRPDLKVMANYLLQHIEPLENHFVSVDPFENGKANKVNLKGIKDCLQILKDGHPLAIFPAGEVSSIKLKKMRVTDKVWNPVVGKLIQKANVKVIPIYFSGKNSVVFNVLGLLHPSLRTVKLPSELFNKHKKGKIIVRIGKAINPKNQEEYKDPNELMRFLRAKTYALGSGVDVQRYFKRRFILPKKNKVQKIIDETPLSDLQSDLKNLSKKSLLFDHGSYQIYIAPAREIPNILREISRLREITFRAVGEGTNMSFDSDEYDLYYKHLFIWDNDAQLLVGSYRIGVGDEIYAQFRKKGFYLNETFRLSRGFVPILKSSLELGRSFIREEYQRKPLSLMFLWKGVNEYLKKENYKYRYLIGPVSISNNFSKLSKDLLVDFITKNHFDPEMATLVSPRNEFRYQFKGEGKLLRKMDVKDLKILDQWISEIELSHNKMPVLLKKYLLQNAKIIGFNIDPDFNDCLDGFLVMDLEKVPNDTFDMVN